MWQTTLSHIMTLSRSGLSILPICAMLTFSYFKNLVSLKVIMSNKTMISARALTGMPEFVHSQVGEKGLSKAYAASGLNEELLGETHHFILKTQVAKFMDSAARQFGEEKLGLLLAPHLSVSHYGIFGEYVASGTTLRETLYKSVRAIRYHCSFDHLLFNIDNGRVTYRYIFAPSTLVGHEHITYGTVGVLLSVIREYLGPHWCPDLIQIEIEPPRNVDVVEEIYGSKVSFGGKGVALFFDERYLEMSKATGEVTRLVSLQDIHNKRYGAEPTNTNDVVRELVRGQILGANASLETTARVMGLSIRTFQRALDADGTNFRSIVNSLTAERAVSLLTETNNSITKISEILGYSDPAHFARAFKKVIGIAPMEYKIVNSKAVQKFKRTGK